LNLAAIRNLCRDLLDEPGSERFADSELNTWINRGHKRFVAQSLILQEIATTTTVVGQRNYGLPDDWLAPEIREGQVTYDDKVLEYADYNQFLPYLEEAIRGTPWLYSIYNGQIHLEPIPDQAKTLRLLYLKAPSALLLDTDVPEYDEDFHEAGAFYAAYIAKRKDKDHVSAALHLADFNALVQEAAARAMAKTQIRYIREVEDLW